PFTVSATADMAFLLEIGPKALFFAPTAGPAGGRGKIGSILPRGVDWNKSTLNRRRTAGQGCLAIYEASERSPSALRDRRGELDEEIVGGLLRRAVDETLAKLAELAADLCFHVIGEQ